MDIKQATAALEKFIDWKERSVAKIHLNSVEINRETSVYRIEVDLGYDEPVQMQIKDGYTKNMSGYDISVSDSGRVYFETHYHDLDGLEYFFDYSLTENGLKVKDEVQYDVKNVFEQSLQVATERHKKIYGHIHEEHFLSAEKALLGVECLLQNHNDAKYHHSNLDVQFSGFDEDNYYFLYEGRELKIDVGYYYRNDEESAFTFYEKVNNIWESIDWLTREEMDWLVEEKKMNELDTKDPVTKDELVNIYTPYSVYVFNDVHLDAEYDYGPSDFNVSEGLEHLLERIVIGEVEPEPNVNGFVDLDIDVEGVVLIVDDSGSLPKVIEFYADSYELNEQKNPLVHLNADLPVKESTKLLSLYKNALEQQSVHSIDEFEWLNDPSANEHPSYYAGLIDGLESSICALGEINQEQLMQLRESWEKDIKERSVGDEKMKKFSNELEI